MNADLSGPKQPKRSAWDAFNADIELWLAKAAATQPLKLVVKDVAVRDADATPWHRASAERAIAELDGLVALVRSLPPRETGSSQYSFVDPLLDAILQAVSVRDLAPQQREACIELLGRGGSVIRPRHLAALVGSYPAKERAGLVQALLRSHHVGVMGLFTAAPTRLLLLDDAVYATALEHAPHHPTPFFFWLRDKRMAPGPPEQTQWALRMLALIDKNGELAKEAAEEEVSGTNRFFRSNLRDLNELRAKLESAARAEALRRGAP
ncbi:MAG TPA: hypothetical protein VGK73_00770 [Polyangiaceae bacterium]